jgi:hypothetical protein
MASNANDTVCRNFGALNTTSANVSSWTVLRSTDGDVWLRNRGHEKVCRHSDSQSTSSIWTEILVLECRANCSSPNCWTADDKCVDLSNGRSR